MTQHKRTLNNKKKGIKLLIGICMKTIIYTVTIFKFDTNEF